MGGRARARCVRIASFGRSVRVGRSEVVGVRLVASGTWQGCCRTLQGWILECAHQKRTLGQFSLVIAESRHLNLRRLVGWARGTADGLRTGSADRWSRGKLGRVAGFAGITWLFAYGTLVSTAAA